MGVAVGVLLGEPHPLQHGVDDVVGLVLPLYNAVGQERLGDDIPDRHPGVQGRVGVLENHLHFLSQGL